MPVFLVKERLYIEGLMPERALLRLRRAEIPLFDVKKIDAKTLRMGSVCRFPQYCDAMTATPFAQPLTAICKRN